MKSSTQVFASLVAALAMFSQPAIATYIHAERQFTVDRTAINVGTENRKSLLECSQAKPCVQDRIAIDSYKEVFSESGRLQEAKIVLYNTSFAPASIKVINSDGKLKSVEFVDGAKVGFKDLGDFLKTASELAHDKPLHITIDCLMNSLTNFNQPIATQPNNRSPQIPNTFISQTQHTIGFIKGKMDTGYGPTMYWLTGRGTGIDTNRVVFYEDNKSALINMDGQDTPLKEISRKVDKKSGLIKIAEYRSKFYRVKLKDFKDKTTVKDKKNCGQRLRGTLEIVGNDGWRKEVQVDLLQDICG